MTKLSASLSVQIHAECPQCETYLDITDADEAIVDRHDCGQPQIFMDFIGGDDWREEEYDVECLTCECKFKVTLDW